MNNSKPTNAELDAVRANIVTQIMDYFKWKETPETKLFNETLDESGQAFRIRHDGLSEKNTCEGENE